MACGTLRRQATVWDRNLRDVMIEFSYGRTMRAKQIKLHVLCLRPSASWEVYMSEHIYKIVQLVGSSPHGVENAIQNAIERASKNLKHLRWFEVLETRGHIENGKVSQFQVTLKVGFTLADTLYDGE
jgi:flavin-binding protein dodecin